MSDKGSYENTKVVKDTLKTWSSGQKGTALQLLLEGWVETFPKNTRKKVAERLDVLATHFGTEFEVKRQGKVNKALRKATLSKVLQQLTLFVLGAADSTEKLDLGVLDNGSAVSTEVIGALRALRAASGPQVQVPAAEFAALQEALKELKAKGGKENEEVLRKLEGVVGSSTPVS